MSVRIWNFKEKKQDVSYEGCVLGTRERNYHDDSDFYAVCWNEEKQAIVEVTYASTRYCSGHSDANTDATEEVIEKAKEWTYKRLLEALKEENVRQAQEVGKGKTVKILRGKNKGFIGEIFWMGRNQFDPSPYGKMRYGVKNSDGDVIWTGASMEIINWEQYLKSEEDIDANACYSAGVRYNMPINVARGMAVI